MDVELTSEDRLRLNVLAVNAEAIRINENSLQVFGLKGEREMKAQLHPAGNTDRYLKKVRELLASVALDSPGGYPVFLQRWTRMGQVDHQRLGSLLKLAEPEAVMAVVCSPGLTHELALRAWWCDPQAEKIRVQIEREMTSLEREKRFEEVACWRDTTRLRGDLREALRELGQEERKSALLSGGRG